MVTNTLKLTPIQLRLACAAWEQGGCLGLGNWAARAKFKDWGVRAYGELIELVRAELGDNVDYSTAGPAAGA